MPLQPRRLPRKFNRTTSKVVDAFVRKSRSKRKQQTSFAFQRMMRRTQLRWLRIRPYLLLATSITLTVVVIATLVITFFSPLLHVRTISVAKQSARVDIAELQKQLQPLFNRHLFFITSRQVESMLLSERRDVETVSINKDYPDHIIVDVTLKPVVAVLRSENTPVQNEQGEPVVPTQYCTADGLYVYSPLPLGIDVATLPIIDIVDIETWPTPGDFILEQGLLEHMMESEVLLQQTFGYTVQKRTVFVRAQEYHLNIGDRTLWFDIRSTSQEQIDKYSLFLSAPILYPVTEYIDLRLFHKVIWK